MTPSIFDCRHPPGAVGSIDDSDRKFKPNEQPIAEHLKAEGHHVKSQREGRKYGKTADSLVCGQSAEFKAMNPKEGGKDPHRRVVNQITDSAEQGPRVVVDARPIPAVRPEHVESGVRHALNIETDDLASGNLKEQPKEGIRVIGQGYDMSYDKGRLQGIRQELAKDRALQTSPAATPPASENRFQINWSPGRESNQAAVPARRYDLGSDRGQDDPQRRKGPSK